MPKKSTAEFLRISSLDSMRVLVERHARGKPQLVKCWVSGHCKMLRGFGTSVEKFASA